MRYILLTLLLSFPLSSNASNWTTNDTYREIIAESLILVDYGQTRDITANPTKFKELNPILGEHPTTTQVDTYMLTALILHPIIAYALPPDYRHIFQYITIGLQLNTTINNTSLGLKINF